MGENIDGEYWPDWSEILKWVYLRQAQKSNDWCDEWLESHPLDWLMAVRYLKTRVEDRIALAKAHRRLHLDANGHLDAMGAERKLQYEMTLMRRLALRNGLDDQLNHAKYLLGNDRLTSDTVADVLANLTHIRAVLVDDNRELRHAVNALDSMMRNLAQRLPVQDEGSQLWVEEPGTTSSAGGTTPGT